MSYGQVKVSNITKCCLISVTEPCHIAFWNFGVEISAYFLHNNLVEWEEQVFARSLRIHFSLKVN